MSPFSEVNPGTLRSETPVDGDYGNLPCREDLLPIDSFGSSGLKHHPTSRTSFRSFVSSG